MITIYPKMTLSKFRLCQWHYSIRVIIIRSKEKSTGPEGVVFPGLLYPFLSLCSFISSPKLHVIFRKGLVDTGDLESET